MKKNYITIISSTIIVLLAVLVALTAISWFKFEHIFYIMLGTTVVACVFAITRLHLLQSQVQSFVKDLSYNLESSGSDVLTTFNLPILVCNQNDEIIWYNDTFRLEVMQGRDIYGEKTSLLFEKLTISEDEKNSYIEINNRTYNVYSSQSNIQGSQQIIMYFVDETDLNDTKILFSKTRPAIAIIMVDTFDEMCKGARESTKDQIAGLIEGMLEEWIVDLPCFSRKLSRDTFIMVLQEQELEQLTENKFDILQRVKEHDFGTYGTASLSIGVGRGDTLKQCEDLAHQALDMALGRGGDQAVVKHYDKYKFYGGISSGVERRNKVKVRVVVTALKELLQESQTVFIMGHSFPDFDAVGAEFGLLTMCKRLNATAYMIIPTTNSPAKVLIDLIIEKGYGDCLITEDEALNIVDETSLLICCDTHRAPLLESPKLYVACDKVVVIDHHRKTVDYIDRAVIFYHEPNSSSTCEMVTEMLQYVDDKLIEKFEAEALLCGITLDTHNFVLRTGVRTFEASAYLRSRGADPIEVKKIFAGTIDAFRVRTGIVTTAEIYDDCAISESEEQLEDMRVAAAQAADELLTIKGVNASFVLFQDSGLIHISARSLGAINVQIIMEKLGGGGHQTMAAAQIDSDTPELARQKLMMAINEYKANL